MARALTGRLTAVGVALFVVGLVLAVVPTAVSASAKSSSGGLQVRPSARLSDGEYVTVFGGNQFSPGDEVILMQCLRSSTQLTGCDPETSTVVTAGANGRLPKTSFTVETGEIGTGTCGTSASDYNACEIAAQDVTSNTLFAAFRAIKFLKTSSSTTLPLTTLPSTTLPSTTLP